MTGPLGVWIVSASSCTGIVVGSNWFFCWAPHQKLGPICTLASSSSLLVTGDVHEICVRLLGWFSFLCSASLVAMRPLKVRPELEPPASQCRQLKCRSVQPTILLRGVTCQVRRTEWFRHSPSSSDCLLKSGA